MIDTNEDCIPTTDSVQERRDVRRTTSRYTPVLLQPVIQSVKDCNTAEKELSVVVFETQKSTRVQELKR